MQGTSREKPLQPTHVIVNTGQETVLDTFVTAGDFLALMPLLMQAIDRGDLVLIDGELPPYALERKGGRK
jgi:hypothetical protein